MLCVCFSWMSTVHCIEYVYHTYHTHICMYINYPSPATNLYVFRWSDFRFSTRAVFRLVDLMTIQYHINVFTIFVCFHNGHHVKRTFHAMSYHLEQSVYFLRPPYMSNRVCHKTAPNPPNTECPMTFMSQDNWLTVKLDCHSIPYVGYASSRCESKVDNIPFFGGQLPIIIISRWNNVSPSFITEVGRVEMDDEHIDILHTEYRQTHATNDKWMDVRGAHIRIFMSSWVRFNMATITYGDNGTITQYMAICYGLALYRS